jgi:hypothetical protein
MEGNFLFHRYKQNVFIGSGRKQQSAATFVSPDDFDKIKKDFNSSS